MAGKVELARAFVTLVPSFEGAQREITEGLFPAAGIAKAAGEAGTLGAQGFGAKFKSMLAPLLAGATIAGAFKGLMDIGHEFETMTNTIRSGTGASGKSLEELRNVAINVGKSVPDSFEKVGTVVADLNTALGYTGKPLEDFARQALNLGKITGTAVNVRDLAATMKGFNVPAEKATAAMDDLYRVSQATGVPVNELTGKLKTQGAILGTVGFSLRDSAALMGSLSKAGINADSVINGMGPSLVRLARSGEQPAEAFKRVVGEIGTFLQAGDKAAALDLAGKVFGTRNAAQFVSALQSGALSLDDIAGKAGLTGDTINGVARETRTMGENWDIVKNNAKAALEPLASNLLAGLADTLQAFMPTLQALGDWLGQHSEVVGVLAVAIGTTLVAAFVAWTASVWAANAALLANPITWIVVGIGLIIAALVLLYTQWDTVVADVTALWQSFTSWLTGCVNGIAAWWSGVWGSITSFFSNVWQTMCNAVTSIVGSIITFVQSIPGRILAGLSALAGLASSAAAWFGGFLTSAKNKFLEAVSFVGSIPGKILGALGSVGSILYNSGASIINGFVSGIKAGFSKAVSAVKSGLAYIRSFFPFSPAKRGPFAGRGWVAYSGAALGETFLTSTADALRGSVGVLDAPLSTVQSQFSGIDANGLDTMASGVAAGSAGRGVTVNQYITRAELPKASRLASEGAEQARLIGGLAW